MNKLLVSTTSTIIICVVVAVVVLIFMLLVLRKKKKENFDDKATKINGQFIHLELKPKYMVRKQLKFYYLLHKILPKEYIAFPNVGVDNLCAPLGNRVEYNKILSKYVDFVIFEEATMKPLLVIDVYDMSYGDESISEFEPDVVKALEAIHLPLVQFMIKDEYDETEIKKKIMDTLEPPKSEKEEEKKN
ncbi:MAG: DUF2726 domain-containing protein [Christensenellales bacterium]